MVICFTSYRSLGCTFLDWSFYWLSGKFPQADFAQYAERVSHYYAPYAGYAVMYAVVGFAVVRVVKSLPDLMARKTA